MNSTTDGPTHIHFYHIINILCLIMIFQQGMKQGNFYRV